MTGNRLGTAVAILLAIVGGCTNNPSGDTTGNNNPAQQDTPDNNPPNNNPTGVTSPNVTVVSWSPGPVRSDANILFGVAFDQPVSGFDDPAADVQLQHSGTSGGQIAILPIDARTFTVLVTDVTGDGQFQLLVPAGAAQDAEGNVNTAGLSSAVLVDNTPPQVTEIGTQVLDGRYPGGTSVDVTVNFSEPVSLVDGTLGLQLNTGQTLEYGPFTLLSTVSATYQVQAGDNADPLESVALTASAGTKIIDAAGNVGQIVLPTATLAAKHHIVIDTTPPVVSVNKAAVNSLTKVTGTVNDPSATVYAGIAGGLYAATNNGDGTWSLAGVVPAAARRHV